MLYAKKNGLGASELDGYTRKNRRRQCFAVFSFGLARCVRARVKIEGVKSVI